MDLGVIKSLLGFLIIGGLLYLMMRKGGCCGHSHGGRSEDEEHSHEGSNTGKIKDSE